MYHLLLKSIRRSHLIRPSQSRGQARRTFARIGKRQPRGANATQSEIGTLLDETGFGRDVDDTVFEDDFGGEGDTDITFLEDDDDELAVPFHKSDSYNRVFGGSNVAWKRQEDVPEWFSKRASNLLQHDGPGIARLASDYRKLSIHMSQVEKLCLPAEGDDIDDNGVKTLEFGPREAYAYTAFRTTPNFAITRRVLRDAIAATSSVGLSIPKVKHLLDFGSGPGSATCAVLDVFETTKLDNITLVEPSRAMLEISQHILGEDDDKTLFGDHVSVAHSLPELLRTQASNPGFLPYEVVASAFSLFSLPSDTARSVATSILWELVAPGGLMVVIESGTQAGSEVVAKSRETILDCIANEADGRDPHLVGQIIAPCTHSLQCPLHASKSQWCHFAQTVPRLLAPSNMQKAGGHHFHRAKYSYIVVRKAHPDDQYVSNNSARIVRNPLRRTGHTVLDLCTPDGSLGRYTISKGKMKDHAGTFFAARKSTWGGVWPMMTNSDDT